MPLEWDYPMLLHFLRDTRRLATPATAPGALDVQTLTVSLDQGTSRELYFIGKTQLAFFHRNRLDYVFRNMLVGVSSELSRRKVLSPCNKSIHFTWQVNPILLITTDNSCQALAMSCVSRGSKCFTCAISFNADNHSKGRLSELWLP